MRNSAIGGAQASKQLSTCSAQDKRVIYLALLKLTYLDSVSQVSNCMELNFIYNVHIYKQIG